MFPVALLVFLSTLTPVFAQSGSGIEELSLEGWLIVGVLLIVVVGAVVCIWTVLIVRVCRISYFHRKAERELKRSRFRLQNGLEQRYGRQPDVSGAELRAVSLRNTDSQLLPPSSQQARPTPRYTEPTSRSSISRGIGIQRSPRSNSNDRRAPSLLNNSYGMILDSNWGSGSRSGMVRSNSDSIGLGMGQSSSNVGMVRSSSNSSGIQPVPSISATSLSTARSNSDFTNTEIVRSPSNSSRQGVLRSSNSNSGSRSSGIHTYQLPPSSLVNQLTPSRPRVMVSSSTPKLQSLGEVEEMDVRPDVGEGPPRYSCLFPVMETSDERMESNTSPFTFNSERRVGARTSDKRVQFNQLSSWPNFK